MRFERQARAVLFIIFSVWTTGAAAGLTIGLSGNVNAQLSAVQDYGAKFQLGGEAAVDVLFPVNPWLAIGPSAGVLGANASDLDGGFGYRSYLGGIPGGGSPGGRAAQELAVRRDSARRGQARPARAMSPPTTARASRSSSPVSALDGTLSFVPAGLPFFRFGLTLPLRVYFRRDFQFSGSAGLGLGIAIAAAPAARKAPADGVTP